MKFAINLLHAAGFIVALWAAMLIGSRWEMQAHPIPDVQVMLNGQQELLTGALSMRWDGSYVLTDGSGLETVFESADFAAMSMPSSSLDYRSWRRWLPVLVALLYLLFVVFTPTRHGTPDQSKGKGR